MTQTLYSEVIDNLLKIEITREPRSKQATLTISNDAKIEREIRQRPHFTGMESTSVPDTAHVLFNDIINRLEIQGLQCSHIRRVNLPTLPPDKNSFSAETTIEVGGKKDDTLRALFQQTVAASKAALAAGQFKRKGPDKWTDHNGGRAAGL